MERNGVIMNIHYLGAVARLTDGTLAAVPFAEVTVHQALLQESRRERRELPFVIHKRGKHASAFLSSRALPS
jgi:hypothetical protein